MILSDYLYHQTERGVLYCGDCLEIIKQIQDESIDCCITSPPYWGLRDYGTADWVGGSTECSHRRDSKKSDKTITGHKNFDNMLGVGDAIQKDVCSYCGAVRKDKQLGIEKTPEQYVANMVNLFREVRRVLKKDGVLWLNLGDSYAGSGHGYLDKPKGKQATNKGTDWMYDNPPAEIPSGLKSKDLVGIPWRVAFALQADGWYLRQDIIWHKPNPMPESVTDRCTKAHEYIFLLTKSAKYYYDNDAVREPHVCADDKRNDGERHTYSDGSKYDQIDKNRQRAKTDCVSFHPNGRNKRSVWTVTTKPFKEAHFATFPPDLILPCVLTSGKDAVILDPFFGSGTTGMVAVQNGRNYIGIDLNEKYCEIAKRRIESALDQTEIDLWED